VKAISKQNKIKRVACAQERCEETVDGFWGYIYFTDEAHFVSKELAAKDEYAIRKPNTERRNEELQEVQPSINVTVHVAGGISYNHKGVFLFYNDPRDPVEKPLVDKRTRPRKRVAETPVEFQARLTEWESTLPPEIDVKPKGNSITQQFYKDSILPHHIRHVKELEAKYGRIIHF
jgi:hypothetical protein